MSWRTNSDFERGDFPERQDRRKSKRRILKLAAPGSSEVPLGGLAAEIVLPFADPTRRALHLGFEDVVGYPA